MVTKQTFEALAASVKRTHEARKGRAGNEECVAACWAIANGAAEHFAESNPRFDRDKFMRACGFARADR
jgi:hypothetical protein